MTEHGSPINILSLPFDSFYFFGVYPFVYFWIFFWSFSRTIRNAIIGFVFIIIDISGEFLCQRNPLKQITLVRLPLGRRHISNGRKKTYQFNPLLSRYWKKLFICLFYSTRTIFSVDSGCVLMVLRPISRSTMCSFVVLVGTRVLAFN